jgi:hypothetical protein
MRSQKALHPSLRRIAPKIWMRAANVNNRFSLPQIDAVGMMIINISDTHPGPEVGLEEIAIDLLQARLLSVSGRPIMHELA